MVWRVLSEDIGFGGRRRIEFGRDFEGREGGGEGRFFRDASCGFVASAEFGRSFGSRACIG
jgi:hypothetical protein